MKFIVEIVTFGNIVASNNTSLTLTSIHVEYTTSFQLVSSYICEFTLYLLDVCLFAII